MLTNSNMEGGKTNKLYNDNKGLTLIELIAAIVLVATIAVLVKPLVVGVIDNIKKESFRREVENGINNFMLIEQNKLFSGEKIKMLLATDSSLEHNKFTGGSFRYKNDKYIAVNVTNGKYCANGEITELVITDICDNTSTEYAFSKYNITINPNGGIYKNSSSSITEEIEAFPQNMYIDNPIRTGYEFKGWQTDIALDENDGLLTTILKADWLATSVSVIINPDGGLYEGSASTKVVQANSGEYYELSEPTKEGYVFDKWIIVSGSDSEIIGNKLKVGTEEVTVKAIYKQLYTLTINLNGGSSSQSLTHYMLEGTTLILTEPTKNGYTFNGWTGEGINGSTFTMGSSNVTISASWNVINYTITYNLNGGSGNNPSSYNIDTTTFTLTNPTKTGYTFNGWTGSNGSSPQTSVTISKGSQGDKTYTANWTAVTYTITYNLNGGSGNNPSSYNIDTTTFTLANPTKTGYTFNGWTGSNGSSPQTSVTISKGSQGDKTYTANWTAVTYTITYNCNDGSGSTASSSHTYDVAKNLSSNGCYKITEGTSGMVYYMAGWSTSSSASAATYTNGQSVTNINNGSNTTLYAVWKNLFSYTGSKNVIHDGNGNWRIKFYTSGTFVANYNASLDVFAVGGGGAGTYAASDRGGGGGGGGYTTTSKGFTVFSATSYSVVIGAGGTNNSSNTGGTGGTSSFSSVRAAGGTSTIPVETAAGNGGNGGSGGGMSGYYNRAGDALKGGSNGGNAAYTWAESGRRGIGQGTTTREFGESTGDLYSGGGSGAERGNTTTIIAGGSGGGGTGGNGGAGTANTGGGGGGSTAQSGGGAGGSGIVIIRNHR